MNNNWQKLSETIKDIGQEMHTSMENDFASIDKIENEDEKKKLKDLHKRTQEAIKSADGKAANELLVELKEFLKNGR